MVPVVKEKPKSPRGDEEGLNEVALERDFKNFAIKLRKQFGEDSVAYQVSNYPEGLEFSVRVAKRDGAGFIRSFDSSPKTEKKIPKKELTEEQKVRRAEKFKNLQAKRREYIERKKQERLENADKDEGDKESNEEPNANGDSAKESQ